MPITVEQLQRVGIQMRPDELEAMVLDVLEHMLPSSTTEPRRDLSPADAAALERGGFNLENRQLSTDPLAQTAAEFAALLVSSLTVAEVAEALGVDVSRVRQRLAARALYGIKRRTGWRVPRFQFDGRRLIPGIEEVIPHLDPRLQPVAVWRWFTTPTNDLALDDDDVAVSPRDWLRAGHDPTAVGALAIAL